MTGIWPRMIVALLMPLCFLTAGCSKGVPPGKIPTASMNRPDSKPASVVGKDMFDALKARWTQEVATIDPRDKNGPEKKIDLLCRRLMELSTQAIQGLIDYATAVDRATAGQDEFERVLHEALILVCLRKADKGGVIRLLASSCPDVIGITGIEFYVVSQAPPTMDDPILLFVAAYRESRTSANKGRLSDVIRRSFRGLPPDMKSERYVEQCEEWYVKNKKVLKLNPEYAYNLHLHYGHEVPLFRYSGNASPGFDRH